jgi:acylphosphatase
MICKRCWVSGRVQGVYYRGSTAAQARRLGVTGHALNLPDGRVEVLVCGEPAAVDALVAWLAIGPSAARVESVDQVEVAMPDPAPIGFTTG